MARGQPSLRAFFARGIIAFLLYRQGGSGSPAAVIHARAMTTSPQQHVEIREVAHKSTGELAYGCLVLE
jgi:hypothetical protein